VAVTRRRTLHVALASTALALSAALTFLSPAGAQTACSVSADDQAVDTEEKQLLDLVNQYRSENRLRALSLDSALTRAAAWFSRDMATNDRFAGNHVDSLGRDIPTRVTDCGATWTYVTENIAAGYASAAKVFEEWRLSPGHNSAMLHPDVTRAGIGRAHNPASFYKWYWTLDLTAGGSTADVAPTPPPPAATRLAPDDRATSLPPSGPPALAPPPPPPPPVQAPPLPVNLDTAVVPPSNDVPGPVDIPSAPATVTPLVTAPGPVALPVETTTGPVLPGVCAILQAQKAAADGQLAAVWQAVAGSLGVGELAWVAAQLEEVRDRTTAHLDAARAAAGCAAPGLGDLDLLTAATAS